MGKGWTSDISQFCSPTAQCSVLMMKILQINLRLSDKYFHKGKYQKFPPQAQTWSFFYIKKRKILRSSPDTNKIESIKGPRGVPSKDKLHSKASSIWKHLRTPHCLQTPVSLHGQKFSREDLLSQLYMVICVVQSTHHNQSTALMFE